MQNIFILAQIAKIDFEVRCNSPRSNRFLLLDFLLSANRLKNKPDLLLLTSKQIMKIIFQFKSYFHLSEAP